MSGLIKSPIHLSRILKAARPQLVLYIYREASHRKIRCVRNNSFVEVQPGTRNFFLQGVGTTYEHTNPGAGVWKVPLVSTIKWRTLAFAKKQYSLYRKAVHINSPSPPPPSRGRTWHCNIIRWTLHVGRAVLFSGGQERVQGFIRSMKLTTISASPRDRRRNKVYLIFCVLSRTYSATFRIRRILTYGTTLSYLLLTLEPSPGFYIERWLSSKTRGLQIR